jgi:hypothetical protein
MSAATPMNDTAALPSYSEKRLGGLDPAALIELMLCNEDRLPRGLSEAVLGGQ